MSALVKQDNSLEQQTPREYTAEDCKNLVRQISIFTENKGLSRCDFCNNSIPFSELERPNNYSDLLYCKKCLESEY